MHHVLRTSHTPAAVAGQLERGVRPHSSAVAACFASAQHYSQLMQLVSQPMVATAPSDDFASITRQLSGRCRLLTSEGENVTEKVPPPEQLPFRTHRIAVTFAVLVESIRFVGSSLSVSLTLIGSFSFPAGLHEAPATFMAPGAVGLKFRV